MAKQKNNGNPAKSNATRPAPAIRNVQTVAGDGVMSKYRHLLIPVAIAVITWLFLSVCLENKLTNWDDPGYIRDNSLIKDLSSEGLKNIFTTSVMGNYHPLTILSYAIEYSHVRLDPWLYHLDSLLLHILVTILVYAFVNLLTRRPVAAAVTALLFGLHPMHVESVAWLAGRKDVLYGSFYIAACITHLYFIRTAGGTKWKWYGAGLLLFICSLLAKPVAVTLPLTLLLIDYFENRKIRERYYAVLTEKIPYLVIAIGFGIRSVLDQQKAGALNTENAAYTFVERIGLGGYAFITYLWKAVLPAKLSCFYPYPPKPAGGSIDATYYIYPVAAIAILALVWKFFRKNKIVMFGVLFFLVNIALLLQFLPVGAAIIADRYTYIPYIGLFFMAGWYVSGFFEAGGNKQFVYPVLGAVLVYILALGYLSNERCKAWYDTTSLWRNEIELHPETANGYNNLGFDYFNKFDQSVNPQERKLYYDSAYYLLNRAIAVQPGLENPYISLGELLRTAGQFAEAKKNYYAALALEKKEKQGEAYLGLAIIYAMNNNLDSSGYCFRKALEIKPDFPEAHSNYGNFLDMTGKRDSAIVQYTIAIAQNPDMDAFYLNRGRAYMRTNRWEEALQDFQRAIDINPSLGENFYARSLYYNHTGNKAKALQDVQQAISLGFTQIDQSYYDALRR